MHTRVCIYEERSAGERRRVGEVNRGSMGGGGGPDCLLRQDGWWWWWATASSDNHRRPAHLCIRARCSSCPRRTIRLLRTSTGRYSRQHLWRSHPGRSGYSLGRCRCRFPGSWRRTRQRSRSSSEWCKRLQHLATTTGTHRRGAAACHAASSLVKGSSQILIRSLGKGHGIQSGATPGTTHPSTCSRLTRLSAGVGARAKSPRLRRSRSTS